MTKCDVAPLSSTMVRGEPSRALSALGLAFVWFWTTLRTRERWLSRLLPESPCGGRFLPGAFFVDAVYARPFSLGHRWRLGHSRLKCPI